MSRRGARRAPGRWWTGPVIGLAASLVVFPLLRTTLFLGFEQKTVDARMRVRGEIDPSPDIAVCAIDAKSVDRLGQWPWSRTILAQLIDRLRAAGARAIVFDAVFSEPARCGPSEDEDLAGAIARAGNVVLGYYLTSEPNAERPAKSGGSDSADPVPKVADSKDASGSGLERVLPSPVELATIPPAGFPEVPSYPGIETNIPILARAEPLGGHFVVRPDADGTVRHYSLVLLHDGQIYPALALRAAQRFLGGQPISVRPLQARVPLVRVGDLAIPTSEKGELWVNFLGPIGTTFPYYPIVDVLGGSVPDTAFKDKLVFVGATETGIGDITTSPFDPTVPGIEVHATVADNLLRRRFILDGAAEAVMGMLAVLLLGTLCGTAAGLARRPMAGAAAALLLLAVYTLVAHEAFVHGARHLYLFVPLLAGSLGFTASAAWRNVFAEAKARQIRRTFQQFVSEAVVEEMLQDPDKVRLGGEKRELTVLFSDIRGFTSMSEKLAPEQVVSILNEYLTPMTQTILDRGGTIDKYMGDAIMAFFGAPVTQPDHPLRACGAAIAMRETLAVLNREWSARGLPTIANGIGLNTGPMSVGNMGSTMIFDYTVIGDHVNLGSRLEGLTKMYGVAILASEHTEAMARSAFTFREVDRVRVKGKSDAVRIFELLSAVGETAASGRDAAGAVAAGQTAAAGGDAAAGEQAAPAREFLENFAAGLAAYRAREFSRAEELFRSAARLRETDQATALYLKRIDAFRVSPPPDDWDGATNLTEK